jgi:hypothetical protein
MMARPRAADLMAEQSRQHPGYSGVAAALNAAFDWPDGRVIDRRQVERWHARRTLNQAGQAPPSPVRKRRGVPRTSPKVIFDPADWIEWARPGVPGAAAARPVSGPGVRGWRNMGWTVPVAKSDG